MLESIAPPKKDAILSLTTAYLNDNNPNKMDLGVGVYRENDGQTPIMKAVLAAERQLLETETTKSYQGLNGDQGFNELMLSLVLEGSNAYDRASALHTPGSSGALHILADLALSSIPDATIWLTDPSYLNHRPIMERAGFKVEYYPYLNRETKRVNEEAMLAQIAKLGSKDVLLLHGRCHNPTGADISLQAWKTIAELANKNGFLPFVDLAYQGFGDSLQEDLRGLHILADAVDEMLLATSCSKNFGLYRERTGAAIVIAKNQEQALIARQHLGELARGTYSMPPAHGAAVVRTILANGDLRQMWEQELTDMNLRIQSLRKSLVEGFRNASQSERFDFFGEHKGMFSLTCISEEVATKLKQDNGIYVVGGGRINIAGIDEAKVGLLVDAFLAAGG